MKLRKRVRRVGESLLLLLGMGLIPLLPRACVVGLARALGSLGRRFSARTRRLAWANLGVAFGASKTEAEKNAIIRESYRVFALVLLDVFWFSAWTRRRLARLVTFDPSVQYYRDAHPALVVTAHFGNWEIMGQSTALLGDPIVSVATPLKNPLASFLLDRFRQRTGQDVERRIGAVKATLAVLRRGGRMALLLDQNTLPSEGGVFVNFFGLPVPVSRAAASLARRTGAAVVIAYSVAEADGRYRIFVLPPVPALGEDDQTATQTIVARIEDVIRQRPGQWLWMYKRWKYVPEGAPREQYPFYARPVPAEGAG